LGDENSLQGRTQAHKHSATSSDGGFLETTVTGVTNLSHGSIVYGDAGEIVTELPKGAQNEVLTMGVNVPQWASSTATLGFTKIYEVTAGSSLDFGSVGGTDLSGYTWVKVMFSCATSGANSYLAFNFFNNTTTIGAGAYNSQGIFGSRVVAVAYSSENAVDGMPFCFTDGTPASTVGGEFSFCIKSNGLATNNHTAWQTCLAHGGEATAINWNSSACAFNSASDLSGFEIATYSGTTFVPVANSVHMTVWAS
jgi:hypothetical protein